MTKTGRSLLAAGTAGLLAHTAQCAPPPDYPADASTSAHAPDIGSFNNTAKRVPDVSSLLLYGKVETGFMYGNSDAGQKNRQMWNGTSYWD
jgi:hypothetical protein